VKIFVIDKRFYRKKRKEKIEPPRVQGKIKRDETDKKG
jgi:hypothetical protein